MFTKVFAAALIAVPFVAKSVFAGDCVRSYTVQEGDICDYISESQSVSTYQLATINEGYIDSECSNLEIGATFCIGYEGEDCDQTYVVKAGDTCEAIAESNSIDSTTLFNNNPNINSDCSNIYIGEVLAVCDTVIVPPAGESLAATAIPATATAAVSSEATPTVAAIAESSDSDDDEYEEVDNDDESLPYCDEL